MIVGLPFMVVTQMFNSQRQPYLGVMFGYDAGAATMEFKKLSNA